jgi:hypothetical protein
MKHAVSFHVLAGVLGLALGSTAEVVVDDFTAGDRIRLGYDMTEYGVPLQPWDVPVPVGSTVTVTTTAPSLLGGSRDLTLHKIAGWNDTPYLVIGLLRSPVTSPSCSAA